MQKGDYLTTILRSNKTVFSIKDIALLWHDSSLNAIRVRLNYYVREGDLYRIRKNFYAKSKKYRKLELANRIFTPSYISFETVLAQVGLIFQYQSAITVASYLTRNLSIEGQTYTYKKVKNSVLLDSSGLVSTDEATIAGKERAFLDTLYLNPDFHFDNLRSVNWQLVFTILPTYQNIRLKKTVEDIYKQSSAAE